MAASMLEPVAMPSSMNDGPSAHFKRRAISAIYLFAPLQLFLLGPYYRSNLHVDSPSSATKFAFTTRTPPLPMAPKASSS